MLFSIEEVYSMAGQYDAVVGITFRNGSEPYKEYGGFLVGVLIYTQREREGLEKALSSNPIPRNEGIIKFEEVNKSIGEEKRKILLKEGFRNNDILMLDTFKYGNENKFIKQQKKSIPNTIPINVDFSDTNEEDFKIWVYNMRLKRGDFLIEEEQDEYYGILLNRIPDKLGKEIIDKATGEIKRNIKFYYLKSKYRDKTINELEKSELLSFFREKDQANNEILKRELKRSGLKLKEIGEEFRNELLSFLTISKGFRTESITAIGKPIYWDFTTLCHIYLRHVEETKIGGEFKGRSVFLYNIEEIRRVIENVLMSCIEEIQADLKEGREFQRYNAQSIYYNGDYFRFRIESSGRLDYFHSYEKDFIQK